MIQQFQHGSHVRANPSKMLVHVLGRGFMPVGLGVGIGALGALATARMLEGVLFGITRTDLATYAGVIGALVGISLLAMYVPARRASAVDPVVALRAE